MKWKKRLAFSKGPMSPFNVSPLFLFAALSLQFNGLLIYIGTTSNGLSHLLIVNLMINKEITTTYKLN